MRRIEIDTARLEAAHPWLLLGSLAVVVGGLVTAFSVERYEVTYAYTVQEALSLDAGDERRLRITGFLVHGTLQQLQECQRTFRISSTPAVFDDGAATSPLSQIAVRLDSCKPAPMLCDVPGLDFEVNVEGRLHGAASQRVFVADLLLTKCPAKYEVAPSRDLCAQAPEALRRLCPICQHGAPGAPR